MYSNNQPAYNFIIREIASKYGCIHGQIRLGDPARRAVSGQILGAISSYPRMNYGSNAMIKYIVNITDKPNRMTVL